MDDTRTCYRCSTPKPDDQFIQRVDDRLWGGWKTTNGNHAAWRNGATGGAFVLRLPDRTDEHDVASVTAVLAHGDEFAGDHACDEGEAVEASPIGSRCTDH